MLGQHLSYRMPASVCVLLTYPVQLPAISHWTGFQYVCHTGNHKDNIGKAVQMSISPRYSFMSMLEQPLVCMLTQSRLVRKGYCKDYGS